MTAMTDRLTGVMGGSGPGRMKNKGAPQDTPRVNPNIPQANSGFFQRMDPTARSALLQTMMQRSRGGVAPAAPVAPVGA